MLPALDPDAFVWYRAGGDLELHLMLVDEPPPERAALLPGRRGRPRRAARPTRGGGRSRPATRRRSSAARASSATTRSGTWSSSCGSTDDRCPDRPRRRDERRQGRSRISPDGELVGDGGGGLPALDAAARLGRAGSRRTGGAPRRPRSPACPRGRSGFSGQMHGLVALGDGDRVLRPAILWNDQRTGAECAEIERRIGLDRLIELTGNRALTGFTAPKLLWLARHEPETYGRIRRILLPKDYVRLRLTGEHAIDVADASGTLLFDVGGRRWSEEVCEALEIPARMAAAGLRVDRDRRRRRPGGGRARGGHRRAGARLGGARDLGCRLRGAARLRARPRGTRPRLLPRRAGDVARDGRDAVGRRVVRVAPAGRSALAYGTLDEEAARWEPGAEGLLFAPYLQGERTPHADPDVRGAFTGLSLRHDRGALARAVLEGVAYGLRDSLELLRGLGVRADGRACLRRRRAERPLAADRRVRARPAARADRVRCRRRLRRGAARRRARGRVRRRGRGRRALRPRPGPDRPGAGLGSPPTTRDTSASAASIRGSAANLRDRADPCSRAGGAARPAARARPPAKG